jgi:hypothetical protein
LNNKWIVSIILTISIFASSSTHAIAIVPKAKPNSFCFSAYKVVKTKAYGKLKCMAYRTPRGIVWIWTRI